MKVRIIIIIIIIIIIVVVVVVVLITTSGSLPVITGHYLVKGTLTLDSEGQEDTYSTRWGAGSHLPLTVRGSVRGRSTSLSVERMYPVCSLPVTHMLLLGPLNTSLTLNRVGRQTSRSGQGMSSGDNINYFSTRPVYILL